VFCSFIVAPAPPPSPNLSPNLSPNFYFIPKRLKNQFKIRDKIHEKNCNIEHNYGNLCWNALFLSSGLIYLPSPSISVSPAILSTGRLYSFVCTLLVFISDCVDWFSSIVCAIFVTNDSL